jgi:phage repressor protein C with HTH and peptisase S24 domain
MLLKDQLKHFRDEKRLTQTGLARLSGVPQSVISDIEAGKTQVTRHLPQLAKALDVAPEQLDERFRSEREIPESFSPIVPVDTVQNPSELPRYSSALAGPEGRFLLDVVRDMVRGPPGLTKENAYAVHIVGDSMEPVFRAGNTAFAHKHRPVMRGDDVVVQLYEDPHSPQVVGLVKRLISYNEDELVLEQFNPPKELRFARERVKDVNKIVWAQKE